METESRERTQISKHGQMMKNDKHTERVRRRGREEEGRERERHKSEVKEVKLRGRESKKCREER